MSKVNHRRRNVAEPHPSNARKHGVFMLLRLADKKPPCA